MEWAQATYYSVLSPRARFQTVILVPTFLSCRIRLRIYCRGNKRGGQDLPRVQSLGISIRFRGYSPIFAANAIDSSSSSDNSVC